MASDRHARGSTLSLSRQPRNHSPGISGGSGSARRNWFACCGLIAILVLGAASAQVQAPIASGAGPTTIAADKDLYNPGGVVLISGTGDTTTSFDIVVQRSDGTTVTGDGTGTSGYDTVASDGSGAITDAYTLTAPSAPTGVYEISVFSTSDTLHTTVLAYWTFYVDASTVVTDHNVYAPGDLVTVSGASYDVATSYDTPETVTRSPGA